MSRSQTVTLKYAVKVTILTAYSTKSVFVMEIFTEIKENSVDNQMRITNSIRSSNIQCQT